MVHFLIVRFLLVLFSFNLIEHHHSMEKKTNFDFELELFRNLIKESNSNESKPRWLVDHQQNSWITEAKSWITKAIQTRGADYAPHTTANPPGFKKPRGADYAPRTTANPPGFKKLSTPLTKTKARNGFIHKLLGQSSKTRPIEPRFDQETEVKDPMEAIKIVSPENNDRFDNWGG